MTAAPRPPSPPFARLLRAELDLQRGGKLRRHVGARAEPHSLPLRGKHHAGAAAGADGRALRRSAPAAGNRADRGADAGADPDLLRVFALRRLGFDADRGGLDVVAFLAGAERAEAEAEARTPFHTARTLRLGDR